MARLYTIKLFISTSKITFLGLMARVSYGLESAVRDDLFSTKTISPEFGFFTVKIIGVEGRYGP